MAELGDKTQLTAITFGANEVASGADKLMTGIIVWLGCSIGLFLADILGMLLGYLLKSKAPEGILNTLAFFVFAIFGITTLFTALGIMVSNFPSTEALKLPIFIIVTALFVVICLVLFIKSKKENKDIAA